MSYETAKQMYGLKGLGPKKYRRVQFYMELAGPPCGRVDVISNHTTYMLCVNGIPVKDIHAKTHLQEHHLKNRKEAIKRNSQWWLEEVLMEWSGWNTFLKCPFGLDRRELWFYHQVRSGTLHTLSVMRGLYDSVEETSCPSCKTEEDTIVHLLVECPPAQEARRRIRECFALQLNKLNMSKDTKVELWFDNYLFHNGNQTRRAIVMTSSDTLAGMMGKEGDTREDIYGTPKVGMQAKRRCKEGRKCDQQR